MINSVNTMEFLKPKLITMDKYNSTKTTKLLPPSSLTQMRTFSSVSGHQNVNTLDNFQEKQTQFLLNNEIKDQDRVRVQHLENHTKLQNNKCWNNFRTLYNISASSNVRDREVFQLHQTKDDPEILDIVNVEHSTSATIAPHNNIQNKSAFHLDLYNKYHNNNRIGSNNNFTGNAMEDSTIISEPNNNYTFYCKQFTVINKQTPTTSVIMMSTEPQQISSNDSQRTEYQNNVYRHIESVHNYAKSKSFEGDDNEKISPNGSRHSSFLDDDEDDDEDDNDDDDDDAEYDNDDDIDYEERLRNDLDVDYEDIFSKRNYRKLQKLSTTSDNMMVGTRGTVTELKKNYNMQPIKINKSYEEDDVHIDVDVETVESQPSPTTLVLDTNSLVANNGAVDETATCVKPDHHARRPMNAFLIFCKRHRAIVKERYKNLENRAITKILGDWWASLDGSDKKCFTNLAQQNKDAFFSANPNFKWYKLPAPPLRSLSTRPSNTFGQEYQEDIEANPLEMARCDNNHGNYFKLADEAQMGDLSQLMQDKTKSTKQCVDLQQVLGETSQFLSTHITGDSEALNKNNLKRRFYNDNSFSSNSSEEDIIEPTKKSARSCKGKRYQELINSGQIATALKKSKVSTRPAGGEGGVNTEMNIKQNLTNTNNAFNNLSNNNVCQKRSLSETEKIMSYELNGFDLEERIKELPALNLDDYLQRKRNTKKKKKFSSNGKKRGQRTNSAINSNNNNNNNNNSTNNARTSSNHNKDNLAVKISQQTQATDITSERLLQQHQHQHQQQQLAKQHQQTATAVGSQKRKARKESITRRDITAIEHEVASLLPLTINGCCYFQEAPSSSIQYKKPIAKDIEANAAISQSHNVASISPIIPFKNKNSSSSSVSVSVDKLLNNINVSTNILNDNMSSSTSDLLILAEVAANSTELKH